VTDPNTIPLPVAASIQDHLDRIEREHGVRVLFACESGSRAWGFASPDSDFDVRFIYVHPRDWYLSIEQRRDVIEVPISDELDIAGWDLRKALGLMRGGNATLVEWLGSPHVYREAAGFRDAASALANCTYRRDRSYEHYRALATKQLAHARVTDPVRIKKFLYALRSSLAGQWCVERAEQPPMRLADLADAMVLDVQERKEIDGLIKAKATLMEKDGYAVPSDLVAALDERLARLDAASVDRVEPASVELFDGFLREWASSVAVQERGAV